MDGEARGCARGGWAAARAGELVAPRNDRAGSGAIQAVATGGTRAAGAAGKERRRAGARGGRMLVGLLGVRAGLRGVVAIAAAGRPAADHIPLWAAGRGAPGGGCLLSGPSGQAAAHAGAAAASTRWRLRCCCRPACAPGAAAACSASWSPTQREPGLVLHNIQIYRPPDQRAPAAPVASLAGGGLGLVHGAGLCAVMSEQQRRRGAAATALPAKLQRPCTGLVNRAPSTTSPAKLATPARPGSQNSWPPVPHAWQQLACVDWLINQLVSRAARRQSRTCGRPLTSRGPAIHPPPRWRGNAQPRRPPPS